MKISVILAHPDGGSFNHAIAKIAAGALRDNGHEVCFHDLYDENFDAVVAAGEIPKDAPLLPEIEKHCAEISEAAGIIVVHPNWWGQPPAILKGWIGRVIRQGIAYEFPDGGGGEGVPNGLLKAKTAIVFNTSNTETEREKNVFGDPIETIWKNCIFGLCGVKKFHRKMFSIIAVSSGEQRKKWLEEVRQTVNGYFPRIGRVAV